MKYKSFEEMPVWQKSMDLAVEIFYLTANLPKSEDYGLTSQIRRSALSVPGNIAEGFGRESNKDKVRFYTISLSSAFETKSHLIYGNRVKYFDDEKTENIKSMISEIVHDLNKLNKSLSHP